MKYIDSDRLKAEIERLSSGEHPIEYERVEKLAYNRALSEVEDIISSLQKEPCFPQENNIVEKVFGAGNLESWEYREAEMLVALAKEELLKSLQQEQPEVGLNISKFCQPVPKSIADCVAEHFWEMLGDEEKEGTKTIETTQQEQPEVDLEKEVALYFEGLWPGMETAEQCNTKMSFTPSAIMRLAKHFYELGLKARKEESSEIGLDRFTEKIKTFQARYKYPKIVSIRGAMAFMARMFYQYPNTAREWYDRLPKATMD